MRGANISRATVIFFAPGYLRLCLRVSASVSYILRLRNGYLPGTMGYVIYSPGTALRATCIKLFLFRFSIAIQNNSFQLVRTAFSSFFFFLSKIAVFFSRCEGRNHWFHRSSVPDADATIRLAIFFKELLEKGYK